jgi:hypothetical protein
MRFCPRSSIAGWVLGRFRVARENQRLDLCSVTAEIVGDGLRGRIEQLLNRPAPTVCVASPFLTRPVAYWLTTLPAAGSGDRRLLVSWAPQSIETHYLSADGVRKLLAAGFTVRNLLRLHAKMVIAGDRAYVGSANLTSHAIDATNAEIGVFVDGDLAAKALALFETWWDEALPLSEQDIESAVKRQAQLAKQRGLSLDYEAQPGHQPRQKRETGRIWIKSLYYRHDDWTIEPGQKHWISDPGVHDENGQRKCRRDGKPAGKPGYRAGDKIGLYLSTTLRVPLLVEVIEAPRFDPEFVQMHNDGGEPDAGERWPWVTPVIGLRELPLEEALDIDYLGIRGTIAWGSSHFRPSPESCRKLLASFAG